MRITTICILLALLATSFDVSAQRRKKKAAPKKRTTTSRNRGKTTLQRGSSKDAVLKGATIEIIQSYKPEVINTPKPEFTTSLPPADTTTPTLYYDVPQQSLSYTYSSFPLRPLALGTDSMEFPYRNYVKVGGGNLSTLLLDAGIASLSGLTYETNIHLRHLSQSGNIEHQQTAMTNLEANGTIRREGHVAHGVVEGLRNQVNHYGYNHSLITYDKSVVRKTYYGLHAGADIKNEEQLFEGLDYHPSLWVSLYGTQATPTFGAFERTIKLNVPVSYEMDTSLSLLFGVNIALTGFNDAMTKQSNNILQFTPGVKFNTRGFKGHAGLYPTIGKNGNTHLLPDIEAAFSIPNTQFSFNVGWKGLLHQNTFEELSTRNPFMWDSYTVKQMRSNEVFGAVQSNLGNHISFGGRFSWWQYNNMPLFINDTVADDKRFLVVYDDKVNAISMQASIRYQIANTFALGFSGTWFNYYISTFEKVWHEPAVQFRGDLLVKPLPKLTVTAYLSAMDELYAIERGNKVRKLNTNLDLGTGAEYLIIPRLTAFLNANNILNNRYERWNNYQAYGFNIFGGARLKF